MPDVPNGDSHADNPEKSKAVAVEATAKTEINDELKAFIQASIQSAIDPLAKIVRKTKPADEEAKPDAKERTKIERIEALEKALEAATKENKEKEERANKKLIHSSLINTATKLNVGADRVETLIDSLIFKHGSRFVVNDDGISVRDEIDETKSVKLDDFVGAHVKSNPWLLPATAVPTDKGLRTGNASVGTPQIISKEDLASGKFSSRDIRDGRARAN